MPKIFAQYSVLKTNRILRVVSLLALFFIFQMILVMVISDAPFEQEIFGRTGRGLGFITYFSLIIIFVYVTVTIKSINITRILQGLTISCLGSSAYSILQYYGFDFFNWASRTNGIIGTLGNPNFQSSFIAIAFIPALVYIWSKQYRVIYLPIIVSIFIFTLYITESTQGYIALASSTASIILLYSWYKKSKIMFSISMFITISAGLISVAGMLNRGPLAYYLYKTSVRSRGEMWQTTTAVIKDNPYFGVGLDSLGDYSLKYQSEKTANGIAEYIDNSHNFILQFASTGGIFLSVLYLGIIIISLYSFIKIQRTIGKFDVSWAAIFAAWISFQLQSFISPAAIPTLFWNFIFCGAFVGLNSKSNDELNVSKLFDASGKVKINNQIPNDSLKLFSIVGVIIGLILTYPLFNADKLARDANLKKDALLAVTAAKKYPESVVRYNLLGTDLFNSGLYDLSLDIGRSAIKFNPNAYQTWILILVNPRASLEERSTAKNNLVKIDPLNQVIKNYPIE
jgi:O-antigen ligase